MNKLVCVKRVSDNFYFQVNRQQAENLMNDQPRVFAYTTKSALKAFYKRMAKTTRNEEVLKQFNFKNDQKDNFVMEDNGKVYAYVLRGTNRVQTGTPETEEEVQAKRTWLENLIESACINPNDQTLKNNLIAKMAVFFGLFKDLFGKKDKEAPLPDFIDLPVWQRFIMGYGTLDKMRTA